VKKPPVNRIAWSISEWCEAVSVCRARVYNEIERGRIEAVKVGRMRRIITPPADYLKSCAESDL
jgi:excisionase family DNA binding protein